MTAIDRRQFLIAGGSAVAGLIAGCGDSTGMGSGAAAGIPGAPSVPPSPPTAPGTPAAPGATGTIMDVQHIVVLMQENRAFDHYFGTLAGVRGFGDPRPWVLPSGKSVFNQAQSSEVDEVVQLPFHPDQANLGLQFLEDLDHSWGTTHDTWNLGAFDMWVPNKTYISMVYFNRDDIPWHYGLADAYTVCDGYHCSLLGPTDPNRYHMFTGWVGNDGLGGGPVIDNSEAGYGWTTYPERLEAAGISWKVYQDIGTGLDAAGSWGDSSNEYIGNYGDNSLLYFNTYRSAVAGDPLYDKARTGTNVAVSGTLFDILKSDVANNTVPQISWVVAPYAYSEHGNFPSNYGAYYQSQILAALMSNPDVWSKTVVFITHDENDGLFDHAVPPFPPSSASQGASTVDVTLDLFAGNTSNAAGPYGLGMRVPMTVVSPWSKGGWVCSENFDHTSIIRFMEARFGVHEPNITPWHRAVSGDLTSAFDFTSPDASIPTLPSTTAYIPPNQNGEETMVPYVPPPQPTAMLPAQEVGQRKLRPTPYRLSTTGALDGKGNFSAVFANSGSVGACFLVSSTVLTGGPWTYTVEAGKSLTGTWAGGSTTGYQFSVYGPAGMLNQFAGLLVPTSANPEATASTSIAGTVLLTLVNRGTAVCNLSITNAYPGGAAAKLAVAPGASVTYSVDTTSNDRWYDLSVTADTDLTFLRRFSGHVENGQASMSDPLINSTAGSGLPVAA